MSACLSTEWQLGQHCMWTRENRSCQIDRLNKVNFNFVIWPRHTGVFLWQKPGNSHLYTCLRHFRWWAVHSWDSSVASSPIVVGKFQFELTKRFPLKAFVYSGGIIPAHTKLCEMEKDGTPGLIQLITRMDPTDRHMKQQLCKQCLMQCPLACIHSYCFKSLFQCKEAG